MIMVNKLLYKVGGSKGNSSRLLVNKWGDEKWISKFFKENLENIFPTLKLLDTECDLGEERLDAICWYPKGQFFVILEYIKFLINLSHVIKYGEILNWDYQD